MNTRQTYDPWWLRPAYGRPDSNGRPAVSRWVKDAGLGWLPAVMCLVLFRLMTIPDSFDDAQLSNPAGSPVNKVLWLCMIAGGSYVVSQRWKVLRSMWRDLNPMFKVFVALAVISVLWSIDRPLSIQRLMRMTAQLLVGLSMVLADWNPDRYVSIFRKLTALFLTSSLIFGMVRPDLAIHQELAYELLGAWRGLCSHKNDFGNVCAISLVFWMHGLVNRRVSRLVGLAGVGLCLTCVKLSRSSTSLTMSVVIIVVSLIFVNLGERGRRRAPVFVWVLASILLVYALALLKIIPGSGVLFLPVIMLTGKNLTFTGRSDIWDVLLDHVHRRPLLGSGYGGYWEPGATPGTESYEMYERLQTFYPSEAHNGYLEVLNDLGVVGEVVLIAYLIFYVRQALVIYRILPQQGMFYLLVFFQQTLANFTEAHWFSVRSFSFVITSFATLAMGRELMEIRMEAGKRPPPVVVEPGSDPPRGAN